MYRVIFEHYVNDFINPVTYSFVAAGNRAFFRGNGKEKSEKNPWPVLPERLVIDTQKNAGNQIGIPAMSDDAEKMATLFNITHAQEELYNPYSIESLTARLTREPNAYTWSDILIGKDSALGIWQANQKVIREVESVITTDKRALVLDFGCRPGAENELVNLIRNACRILLEKGYTELSIFSSPPSPAYEELAALSKRKEPYLVSCFIKCPEENRHKGVYVDQLYF